MSIDLVNLIDDGDSQFIGFNKIKKDFGLLVPLKHNKRTLYEKNINYPANINRELSKNNYSLVDSLSPEQIIAKVMVLAKDAGITKFRSNQVMGIEIVFSLPTKRHGQDNQKFFLDCFSWVGSYYKGVLISFDVHLDEAAPHAHAIIFPMVDGKMRGSDMVGYKWDLEKAKNHFHKHVGSVHNLNLQTKASKQRLDDLGQIVIAAVFDDPIKKSILWKPVEQSIRKNPIPYAVELQRLHKKSKLGNRAKKVKTFAQIMTGKGKGSKFHDREELEEIRLQNIRQKEFNKEVGRSKNI